MKSPRSILWERINTLAGRILLAVIILNGVWFFWWRIIPLPSPDELDPRISIAPIQQEIEEMEDFSFDWDGDSYWATPLYSYELSGVVVSRNTYGSIMDRTNSGTQGRTHDLCVIWGETATSGVYKKMKFYNTNYTCNIKWGNASEKEYGLFHGTELGNNHFVSNDPVIRRRINSINRGDQIYFRGYLVEYGKRDAQGEKYTVRRSSTTREDMGNGACETIFVEDIKIIDKNYPVMNFLMSLSRNLLWFLIILKIGIFFMLSHVRVSGK